MARNPVDNGRIYRAVITTTNASGDTNTVIYGPYPTASPAKGQITWYLGQAKASCEKYRNPADAFYAVGHIESAEVIWKKESE
jgi:hypothetical protein